MMSRSSVFPLIAALLLESCSKAPVTWDVASTPLSISGVNSSPSVGLASLYSIQGGVAPFTVSLSGFGTFVMQDPRTVLYKRPWQTGSAQLSVTDFLGKTTILPLTLSPGAVQLGGGADPVTARLMMGSDSAGNLYVLGSTQANMAGNQYGTGGSFYGVTGIQMLYLAKVDALGAVNWISEVSAGTFSTTTALQLAVDQATGKCYFIGTTDGSVPGTIVGTQGVLNGFVGQFDTNGNLAWITQFGADATSNSTPVQLILGSGGITYVGGSVVGSFVTAGIPGAVQTGTHGTQDAFLAQFSSAGAVNWTNQLGGGAASSTTFVQMVQDISSNSYIGGTTDGNLGGTQAGVHGSLDAFVAEFSSTGVLQFRTQVGEGAGTTTNVTGISQDATPNTYILGMTTGTGGTQLGGHGVQDTYVAQITSLGALGWIDQLGGGGAANVLPVTGIYSGGNVYFVGTTDTDLTVYGAQYAPQIGTRGSIDAILVQLNSAGALNWLRETGGGNIMLPSPVLKVTGGNIFVTGSLYGNIGGTQLGSAGLQDAYLLSFTTAGVLNWADQLGGGGISSTSMTQFSIDGSGNLYFSGQTSGLLGGTMYGFHGNRDVFLLKTNSTGLLTWVSQLGAGGSSQTFGVQFVPDVSFGNIYMMGQATRNLIGSLVGPTNFYNSFIIKMNSSGQMQ